MDTAFLIKFLGAIFAIMTPFVNLPMFLSLTDGMSLAEQRRAAINHVIRQKKWLLFQCWKTCR